MRATKPLLVGASVALTAVKFTLFTVGIVVIGGAVFTALNERFEEKEKENKNKKKEG